MADLHDPAMAQVNLIMSICQQEADIASNMFQRAVNYLSNGQS